MSITYSLQHNDRGEISSVNLCITDLTDKNKQPIVTNITIQPRSIYVVTKANYSPALTVAPAAADSLTVRIGEQY